MRRLHERLVARRIALFGGRMSDKAARDSLLVYEMLFIAYVFTLPLLALYVPLAVAGIGLGAYICLGFIALVIVWTVGAAMHFARSSGMDIAAQYGLPKSAWRHVKAKTPASFDRWLAQQQWRVS